MWRRENTSKSGISEIYLVNVRKSVNIYSLVNLIKLFLSKIDIVLYCVYPLIGPPSITSVSTSAPTSETTSRITGKLNIYTFKINCNYKLLISGQEEQPETIHAVESVMTDVRFHLRG